MTDKGNIQQSEHKHDAKVPEDQPREGTPNHVANYRRICLSCGMREEADGTLACGH